MSSKSRHLTFLSSSTWEHLPRYCHSCDTMNWVWMEPWAPAPLHLDQSLLNTTSILIWLLEQLTLHCFYLFKNLHCFSAARKIPRDNNVQVCSYSLSFCDGLLSPFLKFFSPIQGKEAKIIPPKIAETRQMNRGRQSSVNAAKVHKQRGESTRVGPCWETAQEPLTPRSANHV